MMVKAGPPVDALIEGLIPMLDSGDILIDGVLQLKRHRSDLDCP